MHKYIKHYIVSVFGFRYNCEYKHNLICLNDAHYFSLSWINKANIHDVGLRWLLKCFTKATKIIQKSGFYLKFEPRPLSSIFWEELSKILSNVYDRYRIRCIGVGIAGFLSMSGEVSCICIIATIASFTPLFISF